MPEETPSQAHDRGFESGSIAERLAHHDKHFLAINGSIDRVGDEMHLLRLAVQRLGDQATSDAATRITTAAALKAADDQRRDQDSNKWTPLSRVLLVLSIVATFCTIAGFLFVLAQPK